tara:strand:- start:175 stop:366 length:192 start_codon:yes stop_codon:yes gene_type:complete
MELLDYAAIAVLLYISLTIISRAVIIGLYAYFIREWMMKDDEDTTTSLERSYPQYQSQVRETQ